MKNLKQLISVLEPIEIHGDPEIRIKSIQFDSRKVAENDLFVAIRGYETDGHKYIQQALNNSAAAIVCEEFPDEPLPEICLIKVADSRKAIALLADKFYGNPSKKLKLIGVTGTNGKTTITFLIRNILNKLGYKTGLIGTTGVFIGDEKSEATHTTPEPVELNKILAEMVQKGVEYAAMETSSHALLQKRLEAIQFKAGVFTNITHDHLDYHKTFNEYISAKKILFDMLPKEAVAVVNSDDENYQALIKDCNVNKITIGKTEDADVRFENEKLSLSDSSLTLIFKNKSFPVSSNLIAEFNTYNLVQSIAVVHNITNNNLSEIIEAAKDVTGAPGRMEKLSLKNGAIAIIDYAHTPDSLEKAARSCKEILTEIGKGRLITLFGCGGDRDREKRPKMSKAAEQHSDICIITDDNPRTEDRDQIFNDILKGINNKTKCRVIKDRDKAINEAVRISEKNDIILIAGKGHETYQIIGKEKIHFDDKEIVREAERSL